MAKKSFTCNMTPFQIADQDTRRGNGDDHSPYTLSQNHEPVNKKPYLNTDGTHKAIDDKIKGNKNMPFGNNKKVEELLDFESKEHGHIPSPKEEKDECKDDMAKDMYMNSPSGSNGPMPPASPPPPPMAKALEILKGMPDFKKALTTRSFRFATPPPYDGSTTVTNAAAITFTPVDWNSSYEPARQFGEALKSCQTHGITYKATVGCTPCNLYKSTMCKTCGNQKEKVAGGTLACSVHG